jgi:hypothetical protein
MLIELIMVALVVVYVGVVVLGHVLLIAAIYKCLCEDYLGGRRRTIEAPNMPPPSGAAEPLPVR